MRPIKVTAKFKIKSGNLESFKAIIPEIISEVMEHDPGISSGTLISKI